MELLSGRDKVQREDNYLKVHSQKNAERFIMRESLLTRII